MEWVLIGPTVSKTGSRPTLRFGAIFDPTSLVRPTRGRQMPVLLVSRRRVNGESAKLSAGHRESRLAVPGWGTINIPAENFNLTKMLVRVQHRLLVTVRLTIRRR